MDELIMRRVKHEIILLSYMKCQTFTFSCYWYLYQRKNCLTKQQYVSFNTFKAFYYYFFVFQQIENSLMSFKPEINSTSTTFPRVQQPSMFHFEVLHAFYQFNALPSEINQNRKKSKSGVEFLQWIMQLPGNVSI